jgi:hypothetical protein
MLLALLTGCETPASDVSACPPIVEYSPGFQARAADELDAIVAAGHVAIPQMIVDYGRERDMLRACR